MTTPFLFVPTFSWPAAPGGLLYTYGAGGTTPKTTYSDAAGAVPNANPVVLDSNGSATVRLTAGQAYHFVLKDSTGTTTLWDQDNYQTSYLTQSDVGTALYPQTTLETGAGVTAVNLFYPVGTVDRYGTNTTPGTTNMDNAIAAAVTVALSGNRVVTFLDATYLTKGMSVRGSGISIIGQGSAVTVLKQDPSAFGLGGIIELGDTASGNSAAHYSKIIVRGLTIDGNRSNISAPSDDLHGHGLTLTNITNFDIRDVRALNVWNAGVGVFLNNHGATNTESYSQVQARVYNCGNSGAGLTTAGFDINGCRQIIVDVVSEACYAGARLLNNCTDILGRIEVYNPTTQGVILQNNASSGNFVTGCNLDITINTCGSQGLLCQEGVKGNSIRAHIANATGVGCHLVAGSSAAANVIDNWLEIHTENGQIQGLLMAAGSLNRIIHRSKLDGRGGAAGTSYSLDVTGSNNVIDSLVDGDAQVRSFVIRATSVSNKVISAMQTNCLSGYSDSGTGTSLVPVTFEATISGTFNLTSGAAPTVVTGAVTGAAFGDVVQVAWPSNLQGVIAWGYVSSAGNVAVAAYNITGGALNFGAITVTVRITKAAANQVL